MNPYKNLPDTAFWRKAVADKHMFDISGLWNPKFKIQKHEKVVTFGSCFAQHIGRALKERGFDWCSNETPPYGLSEQNRKTFNYNIFSARTGNIYTCSLLLQWTKWALGMTDQPQEVWTSDGRFFDPFRPVIEPNGFQSKEEVLRSRLATLKAFEKGIKESDYFVFTLGLTESWFNKETLVEYPLCPGTVVGKFDDQIHQFENQSFQRIYKNLEEAISIIKTVNPGIKFILTVSPVPLTATNSGNHVLVATMSSKSILRAVAEQVQNDHSNVDYFPSYEIINSPAFRGAFFEPNLRSVHKKGVQFVMDSFFSSLVNKYGEYLSSQDHTQETKEKSMEDILCEEELLDSYARKSQ